MTNFSRIVISLFLLLSAISPVTADEKTLKCPATGDDMAKRVKQTLGPNYHDESSTPLRDALVSLDYLLEETGYCAATARAGANVGTDRQRFIMEWHSMNQWLSRLGGFMALNVKGDFSMNWKDEYELFLEVYELEP